MLKVILFALLSFFPATIGRDFAQQQSFPSVIFLEPDVSTVRIENVIASRADCEAWPVEPFRPRQFSLRGAILDSKGSHLGRYLARGVINNADGSHVAQYALTISNIGTIVYTLDVSTEVFPYETVSLVAYGPQMGSDVNVSATPSLRPGCVWNQNWQIRLSLIDEIGINENRKQNLRN